MMHSAKAENVAFSSGMRPQDNRNSPPSAIAHNRGRRLDSVPNASCRRHREIKEGSLSETELGNFRPDDPHSWGVAWRHTRVSILSRSLRRAHTNDMFVRGAAARIQLDEGRA